MGKAVEFLDPQQREHLASQCFSVDPKISNQKELRGLCPFHEEKNPSFAYNTDKDVYNCSGCGAKGDLIMLWSHAKGLDGKEGFKVFCKEFDKAPKDYHSKRTINPAYLEEVWSKFPPLPEPFIEKMIKERCWTREGIKKLDLRLQTLRWDKKIGDVVLVPEKYQNKIAIAVRNANGKIKNIRFYQPGAKEFKLMSFAPGVGQSRIWPPPVDWGEGPIWILEGEPDVICAISNGINAATQTAGAGTWKKSFSNLFRDKEVIIAYDADGAGVRGAEKTGEQLAKVCDSVKVFRWPDFMGKVDGAWPDSGGQDLTDWFARHKKTKDELLEHLAEAKEIESQKNVLESVERFFPGGTFKPALLAREVMKEWEIISDPLSGLLYRWNDRFWEEFDIRFLRQRALKKLDIEGNTPRVSDVATQISDLSLLPFGTEMNSQRNIMCVKNGMLNLDNYTLYPHDQEYFCSYMINTEYSPDAHCDRWKQFLEETIQDEHTIAVLQEFAGYILTPDISHEKALLLYGDGSDGKSTFVKVLQQLVGEHACGSVSLENLEDQYYRATLHNKFLNVCTETEGSTFYSGMFKAIVSGDTIAAAHKNMKPFEFSPTIKMIYAFNRWPKVLDNTDAFYRRLLPVRFKKQFTEKTKDIDLYDKLLKELPGVLTWALEGLARLRRQRMFTESADMKNTMVQYMFENNPVLGFVHDYCRIKPSYQGEEQYMTVSQKFLYAKYRGYCSKCGYRPCNLNTFSREIKMIKKDIKVRKLGTDGKRYQVFTGIVYIGDEEDDA